MPTLQIDFTVPSPAPVNGFIVKYRPIGTTTYTTVFPNPTSSPVLITIPSGTGYEGTIKSDCGNGSGSPESNFVVYASNPIYTVYGSTLSELCSANAQQLYVSNSYADITTGATVYTNQSLTTPLTSPTLIMDAYGLIYNISGGVVGSSTSQTCSDGRTAIEASPAYTGPSQTSAACASGINSFFYLAPGSILQPGSLVYQNNGLNNNLVISSTFKSAGNVIVSTNSSGVIISIVNC